jgi:hypothetical protein
MANRLLELPELQSILTQCILMDGQPVADHVMVDGVVQEWVAVCGYLMPMHMFQIMWLWVMMGGKMYAGRLEDSWDHLLDLVNENQDRLRSRHKDKRAVEIIFTDITRWITKQNISTQKQNEWFQRMLVTQESAHM